MMIPFAGPLRSITNRVENFGWELVGPRATGKSTLLGLMASTAGGVTGGDNGNFGLTFATIAAGVEGEMRNYADSCMILDEANLFGLGLPPRARGNAMSHLFMSLGRGQEKARYQSKFGTYRFVYATSANEALAQVIAGSSDPDVLAAVADRLMTVSLAGREHGILDRVPDGYADAGDFLSDLVNAADRNHGTAMRHYLRAVVDERAANLEDFACRVDARVREFCEAVHMERNNGSARRVAEGFGLVYVAGRIARHVGALPKAFDPMASALEAYRVHAQSISGEPPALGQIRAIAKSSDIITLDHRKLPRMSDKKFKNASGFIKTNRDGDRELLIPQASICKQIENWKNARREFAIKRIINCEGKGHYSVKRDVRSNKKEDRAFCIKMKLLK